VSQYPVHIQPFRDMIDGMRMDLVKSRSVGAAAMFPVLPALRLHASWLRAFLASVARHCHPACLCDGD
jgi:hypothetical protein